MAVDENIHAPGTSSNWTTSQAYLLAAVCLLLGGMMGYLVRGSSPGSASQFPVSANTSAPGDAMQQQVTPEMMKYMADKQAEPLMAKLKTNPKDPHALVEVGNIYYDTQNFREAVGYYQQSLNLRDDVDVRTDLGTAYWQLGDADSALREFEAALKLDPRHANTYYNMGLVKWRGKMDVNGAVDAWEKLLQMNPNFPQKDQVENLIARARQHATIKPGTKTDKPAM